MTRVRIAQVLAVLAALSVLGTGTVAAIRWAGDDRARPGDATEPPAPLSVRDPRTGAAFEVPAAEWRVSDREVRIYYADEEGRLGYRISGQHSAAIEDCSELVNHKL